MSLSPSFNLLFTPSYLSCNRVYHDSQLIFSYVDTLATISSSLTPLTFLHPLDMPTLGEGDEVAIVLGFIGAMEISRGTRDLWRDVEDKFEYSCKVENERLERSDRASSRETSALTLRKKDGVT